MMNRDYHRCYARKYYHKRMGEIKQSLGGKCSVCGSDENLEFHHTDPSTKKFNITSKVLSIRKSDLKEEIEKCVLLCHNCHKKISDKQASIALRSSPTKFVTVRNVKCLEDNINFSSITECSKYYGVRVQTIWRVLSGVRKSWHNKHFEYDGNKKTIEITRVD